MVLEVDTYWAAVGGADVRRPCSRRLGDRVKFIHVKDGDGLRGRHAQVPAGDGVIAVRDILGAATGLRSRVVEFDDFAGDIFDGVAGRWPTSTAGRTARLVTVTGPVGVGFIGAGVISDAYLKNLHQLPRPGRASSSATCVPEVAAAQAEEYGVAAQRNSRGGTRASGRRDRRQPDDPGRARRGRHSQRCRRQARLEREAVRARPAQRAGAARRGGQTRACGWAARRTPSSAPGLQTARRIDRTRRHRPAAHRAHPDAVPGPGVLAPEPGVPVPGRRRTAVRHRPVLPDHAGAGVRSGRPGGRARLDRLADPGRSAPARAPGSVLRRRGADPRRRDRPSSRPAQSAQSIFSFDSPLPRAGFVEITGYRGDVGLPDPNTFDGDLQDPPARRHDWETIAAPPAPAPAGDGRTGHGAGDPGRGPHRITGELAYHVLDIMVSATDSIDIGVSSSIWRAPSACRNRCRRTGTRSPRPSRSAATVKVSGDRPTSRSARPGCECPRTPTRAHRARTRPPAAPRPQRRPTRTRGSRRSGSRRSRSAR